MKKLPIHVMAAVAIGLVAAALILALASSSLQPGHSTATAAGAVAVLPAVEAETADTPAGQPTGVPSEGIRVHGDWTIEVRQPDGSLVSRSQFQNALLSSGASALAKYLARENSVGFWQVTLDSASGGVCGTSDTPVTCVIFETAATASPISGYTFKTLTASVPASGPNAGKFQLSGNATAQVSGAVAYVATAYTLCDYGTADPCGIGGGAGIYSYFTSTTLSAPVTISEGQQILVTVVISFS